MIGLMPVFVRGHWRAQVLGSHYPCPPPCFLLREVAGCGDFPVWAGGNCLTLLVVPCSSLRLIPLSSHCLSPDRFGSVTPDGQYHSPIKNKSARFNAMLAALTPSRLAVTFQALGAMKVVDTDLTHFTARPLRVPGWVLIPGAELPDHSWCSVAGY